MDDELRSERAEPLLLLLLFGNEYKCQTVLCGPGSSVGIATDYGRSGIESRWGRDFPPVQTGPGAHPASCKMGTRSFPGVKCGRGVLLTTHPLLVPRSWKSRGIPLPTLWATPWLYGNTLPLPKNIVPFLIFAPCIMYNLLFRPTNTQYININVYLVK